MAAQKRTEAQRKIDMLLIEQLSVRGHSAAAIAEQLNAQRPYRLGRKQIIYDLDALQRQWQESALQLRHKRKERLLREIDLVRREAWAGYDRSLKAAVKTRAKRTGATVEGAAKSDAVEVVQESEEQAGDPTFLRVIMDCNKREAELLGLDAPRQVQLEPGDTAPVIDVTPKVVLYLPHKRPLGGDKEAAR